MKDNSIVEEVIQLLKENCTSKEEEKEYLKKILTYGCKSGFVYTLSSYKATKKFYSKHTKTINNLLCENSITSFSEFFGKAWNKSDPLALDFWNQNLLAWYGFEETVRRYYGKYYKTN